MLISWVVVLIAIAGLVIFLVSKTNADAKRIGEIMFFCGLLATCLMLLGKTARLL